MSPSPLLAVEVISLVDLLRRPFLTWTHSACLILFSSLLVKLGSLLLEHMLCVLFLYSLGHPLPIIRISFLSSTKLHTFFQPQLKSCLLFEHSFTLKVLLASLFSKCSLWLTVQCPAPKKKAK